MPVKELLVELNYIFNNEANNIINYIHNQQDYNSDIFDEPVSTDANENRPKSLRGQKGVYVVLFTENKHLTYEDITKWCSVKGAPFNIVWRDYAFEEAQCLYVGSCSSNSLYKRLGEHYRSDNEKYSLNINHPNRILLKDSIRILLFPLKKNLDLKEAEIRIVVTSIEKILHNRLHPLTGLSRV